MKLCNMNTEIYRAMQHKAYADYSQTYESCRDRCVGNWEKHETYNYVDYLLENYTGKFDKALDFGCGLGRMIKRMLKKFQKVDGADLLERNLEHGRLYLGNDLQNVNLYVTNGTSCNIPDSGYDFIYSTICLQHICVHEIRTQILKDFYQLLNSTGQFCIQVGYGWDNGIHWMSNAYDATSTNSGVDFCIPDDSHFPVIEQDLKNMGFKNIKFTKKESPHPEITNYHSTWLFISASK